MSSDSIDAFILAGGLGTRLRGVIDDRPKPLAEVAGKPFVEWLILQARAQRVRRFILCTGFLGEMMPALLDDGRRLKVDLEYSREDAPLGTGGALRLAVQRAHTDMVLVLNGDSYCRYDLKQLTTVHRNASAEATIWLVPLDDCTRYGTVEVSPDGSVRSFHEKDHESRQGLINTRVYLMQRETIEKLPAGRNISLERDVLPALVGRGLHAVLGNGPFIDIGTPESLSLASSFMCGERLS